MGDLEEGVVLPVCLVVCMRLCLYSSRSPICLLLGLPYYSLPLCFVLYPSPLVLPSPVAIYIRPFSLFGLWTVFFFSL